MVTVGPTMGRIGCRFVHRSCVNLLFIMLFAVFLSLLRELTSRTCADVPPPSGGCDFHPPKRVRDAQGVLTHREYLRRRDIFTAPACTV